MRSAESDSIQSKQFAMLICILLGTLSSAGLGQTRRTALLKHFGSVRRIRQATVAELTAVAGVGPSTARAVLAALGDASEGEP